MNEEKWWGSKDWANWELRFAIKVLNGRAFKTRKLTDFLACALDIKAYLEEEGFWWQAKILDHHIHLWQARHRMDIRKIKEGLQR
jgi:hypothetical protein